MQRGEVWWAQLEQPAGRRPVLLLSRNKAYEKRLSVAVAPVTRTIRGIPTEVDLGKEDGMSLKCVVNLDDIATILKSTITEKISKLSEKKMQEVTRAIVFALDLRI